ncbi:MAG: hypothetical protein LIO43_03875 [Clostridiales bacterium]|nr:hypothetical protein [Clostridiales bacterium]
MKSDSPVSDIAKYGAYNMPTSTYFTFVQGNKKGKLIRAILPIDLYKERAFAESPEQYIEDNFDLNDVKIIIPCIKYNSCVSVDGFRMHISSKSSGGKSIIYKPAMQLVLDNKYEILVKRITSYLTKNSKRKINIFDKIEEQDVDCLYDILAEKLTSTVLKIKFGKLGAKLIDKREIFLSLELEQKCFFFPN